VVDGIRHVQAAGDCSGAARLLADDSFSLMLGAPLLSRRLTGWSCRSRGRAPASCSRRCRGMRQRTPPCSPTSSTSCTAHPGGRRSACTSGRGRAQPRRANGARCLPTNLSGLGSRASCPSRRTPSAPTSAASTPSSRSVTGPRRYSGRGSCGCYRPGGHVSPAVTGPVMRGHLPARDLDGMDPAPALYVIRINGLGAAVLSAFPAMPRALTARTPCSPAYWTGQRCTACWPRSRRSAWTCSRSASSPRTANHRSQVTAAHRDGH
jgi:hypothetical protein